MGKVNLVLLLYFELSNNVFNVSDTFLLLNTNVPVHIGPFCGCLMKNIPLFIMSILNITTNTPNGSLKKLYPLYGCNNSGIFILGPYMSGQTKFKI